MRNKPSQLQLRGLTNRHSHLGKKKLLTSTGFGNLSHRKRGVRGWGEVRMPLMTEKNRTNGLVKLSSCEWIMYGV